MADEFWCALENKLVKFRFYFINIYTRFSTPEELIPSALWRSLMSCVRCSQKRKDAQTRAAASSFSFPVSSSPWHKLARHQHGHTLLMHCIPSGPGISNLERKVADAAANPALAIAKFCTFCLHLIILYGLASKGWLTIALRYLWSSRQMVWL